jgi:DNA polymerase III sliding clamp (beta) subunit (PCNA family)
VTTQVVFETATIQDVLKKASAVAPSRGEAFDKAAGILITVMADSDQVMIQATNLDVFYTEWTGTVSVTLPPGTEEVKWRVPAQTVAAVVGSFPIGSGKETTFQQDEGTRTLRILSGRTRSSFQLIKTEYYPEWEIFDPDELVEVEDFAARLLQVEWACADDKDNVFNGINLTGDYAQATDRYKAARVPLKVDMSITEAESLTVPSRILSQIIKQTGLVSVGCTDAELLILPNEHVQIRARLFGLPYPALSRITGQVYEHHITCRKAGLLEILNRAMLMAGKDRFPMLRMFVGKGEIAVMMEDMEEGYLGDILDVPGYAPHERVTIIFTPRNLIDAVDKCPSEQLSFHYDPSDPLRIVKIEDGAGYEAWVMTRRPSQPAQEA